MKRRPKRGIGPTATRYTESVRRAVYAGTFDPVHLGHVDIVVRAARCFDEVVVGVGHNPAKARFLAIEVRLACLREALGHLTNVRIAPFEGLVVRFAEAQSAVALVRGFRDASDLAFELPRAQANAKMSPGLETVFVATDPSLAHVSSSLMKEIASAGGDPSMWLPECAWRALKERLAT
jgi:pantetheine-phosphate adenylyltransferase